MTGRRPLLALLLAASLAACTEPPTRELEAATAAVHAAQAAGADRYAPERFQEAEAALDLARHRLQDKDYRGALAAASDAGEKAKAAAAAGRAAQANARGAVEVAEAEIRVALDNADAALRRAAQQKVPAEGLAAVNASIDQARLDLAEVGTLAAQGDLLSAQRKAGELRARSAELAGQVDAAGEQWRAAHPKGARPQGRAGRKG